MDKVSQKHWLIIVKIIDFKRLTIGMKCSKHIYVILPPVAKKYHFQSLFAHQSTVPVDQTTIFENFRKYVGKLGRIMKNPI